MEKADLASKGLKRCGSCKDIRLLAAYHVRRASPDGLAHKCEDCIKRTCRIWREENPNAFKQWAEANVEHREQYRRDWYDRNRAYQAERYAKWAKQNPHKINALIGRRRAAKLRATPSWANLDAIREIYMEATRLTAETGVKHEVDHIYPLQSDAVCGLHCESNLQILTKVENIRKGNKMPVLTI